MEDLPTYAPFNIEFNHKKMDKYLYYSPRSDTLKNKHFSAVQAHKQRANLLTEIRKSAQKNAGYLKDSDQINKLIATHIDNHSTLGTFSDLKINESIKGFYLDKSDNEKSLSSFRQSKKQKSMFEEKRKINTRNNLSINEDLGDNQTYKTIILPEINNTNTSATPIQKPLDFENMKSLYIDTSIFNYGNLTDRNTEREKVVTINSMIKNLYKRISSKPRETAVEKYVKFTKLHEKNPQTENNSSNANLHGTHETLLTGRAYTLPDDYNFESTKNSSLKMTTLPSGKSTMKRNVKIQQLEPLRVFFFHFIFTNLKETKIGKSDHNKEFQDIYKSCNRLVAKLNSIVKNHELFISYLFIRIKLSQIKKQKYIRNIIKWRRD